MKLNKSNKGRRKDKKIKRKKLQWVPHVIRGAVSGVVKYIIDWWIDIFM